MADLLNPDALHHGLNQLPGWDGTHDQGIAKRFRFADEAQAEHFCERVAALADRADHHPDVTRHGSEVALTLITHSSGGVTQKDLDLATVIESGDAHGDANLDNPLAGETD